MIHGRGAPADASAPRGHDTRWSRPEEVPVATAAQWVEGARPRTLPAAVAPVLVGTGAAAAAGGAVWWKALLALVVALALQVAVNFANDYSDGVRGTDADRVGPLRLVGSGAAAPEVVRRAAFGAFGVAAAAGLVLALTSAWWLVLVGAVAMVAAWSYTGGPHPYGYHGLGELAVFVFFGLVAVCGTTYVQAGEVTGPAFAGAVAVGGLACAILVANNLRDIPTDRQAGKRTLAVLLDDASTRRLYLGLVGGAFVLALLVGAAQPWALVALAAAPLAVSPVRRVRSGVTGAGLVPVLRDTGRLELAYAALLGLGLAVGT
jgi:1,4-dihydroxy-2-naphthoate polyprenyltransferase